jgi:hypothetical protein
VIAIQTSTCLVTTQTIFFPDGRKNQRGKSIFPDGKPSGKVFGVGFPFAVTKTFPIGCPPSEEVQIFPVGYLPSGEVHIFPVGYQPSEKIRSFLVG